MVFTLTVMHTQSRVLALADPGGAAGAQPFPNLAVYKYPWSTLEKRVQLHYGPSLNALNRQNT